MAALGWLAIGLAASVLALLAVPVELAFWIRRDDARRDGGVALRWLFGAVRIPLAPRRPAPHMPERRPGRARSAVSMLRSKGFVPSVAKLVATLWRRTEVRALDLDARLGLGDPADTGRLWGTIGALVAVLPTPRAARVNLTPEFAEAVLEIEGHGRIRIVPLGWIAAFAAFALSPVTLRALWAARQAPASTARPSGVH